MAGLWEEWSTEEKGLFSLTTLWEDCVQFLSVDFFFFVLSMYWFVLHVCMGEYVPCHTWGRGYLTGADLPSTLWVLGLRLRLSLGKHLYLSLSLACHWWLYQDVWKQECLGFRPRFAPALSPSWGFVLSVSFSVLPQCMKKKSWGTSSPQKGKGFSAEFL